MNKSAAIPCAWSKDRTLRLLVADGDGLCLCIFRHVGRRSRIEKALPLSEATETNSLSDTPSEPPTLKSLQAVNLTNAAGVERRPNMESIVT